MPGRGPPGGVAHGRKRKTGREAVSGRPRWILPVIVVSHLSGTSLWFAGNAVLGDRARAWGRGLEADAGHPFFLMKVPSRSSWAATRSSSRVFMTIGPCQATGSPMGRPETRMNRTPSRPALTVTSSPSP
jgi:hypothetical protein